MHLILFSLGCSGHIVEHHAFPTMFFWYKVVCVTARMSTPGDGGMCNPHLGSWGWVDSTYNSTYVVAGCGAAAGKELQLWSTL